MPHVKHPKNQNALLLSEILPLSENFGLVPTTIFSKEGWWHCCRFFPCCEELARWICNEEEIAEVSVLEWQSLLKKRSGDAWAVAALSCMRLKLKLQHSISQEKWLAMTRLCSAWCRPKSCSLSWGLYLFPWEQDLALWVVLSSDAADDMCSEEGENANFLQGGNRQPCKQRTFWVCSSQPTWAAVSMVYQML